MQEEFEKLKKEWQQKLALFGIDAKFTPIDKKVFIPCDDCAACNDGKYWNFEYLYVQINGRPVEMDLATEAHNSMITAVEVAGFLQSKKREGRFVRDAMSISIRKSFGLADFIVGYCEGDADVTKFKKL